MKQAIAAPPPKKGRISPQQQICQLLGWTDEEYFWYIVDNGKAYLKAYLCDCMELAQQFEQSHVFWNWFKKMFTEMDTVLTDGSYSWGELKCRLALYYAVHDPVAVAQERKPPRVVWDDCLKVGKLKG